MSRVVNYTRPNANNIGLCLLGGLAIHILIGFKRFFFYSGVSIGTILVFIVAITYYIFAYNFPKQQESSTKTHFKFLDNHEWQDEVAKLSIDTETLTKPIFEESFLISETLDEFINLILQEFIDSWYGRIIKDTLFQDSIRIELKHVFLQLKVRLGNMDIAKFLVSKLVPIINDHLSDYLRAEERVQAKINNNKGGIEPIDHDIDVARQYRRGKIHQGVTITKNEVTNINEKKYLRSLIGQILPFLLSDKENTNEVGLTLVREILSCTVLSNIIQMTGEGDFYNLLIIKLIGDRLKRQDQVKKLREALDEHTKKDYDGMKEYMITEDMDVISFNNCLDKINEITDIDDLKQLRLYFSLQMVNKTDDTLKTRIKEAQNRVESKISDIQRSEKASLTTVLHDTKLLAEFKRFLKNKRNLDILEFYLAVEKLKAPLTLDNDKLSLSLGFSNSDEIRDISQKLKLIDLKDRDYSVIDRYINCKDLLEKTVLYQQAQTTLFDIQSEVLTTLQIEFDAFSNTNEYLEIINKEKEKQEISPIVIQAVEDAFTQIMNNNDDKLYEPDKKLLTIDLKKDLFGETSTLFSDQTRYSKLFEDLSDESGTDSDSINDDNLANSIDLENSIELNDENDERLDQSLVLAAPGNLKLTEEIGKLTDDINRLTEQQNIVISLIKKAEITKNLSELKILRNSKVSLEKEINNKELQKQQYIVQENDNSLFGRSRVSCQSYIIGNENGKEFILYIIEVQRFSNDDPSNNTAGWIIARRFSQFYKLHEYLKNRYPKVANLKFPRKTMFKLHQRQIIEQRRIALEEYLKEVIQIPEVCSDKAFRSFLSSETFNLRKNQGFDDNLTTKKELITKIFNGFKKTESTESKAPNNENLKEMEKELKSFDEKELFIKPVIDILITIFKLKNSKNWLRGRALIVILQQIFGTTIERKLYDQIKQLTQEEKLLDILILLKNIIFPNGKFKDPPIIRSNYEKATTKEESSIFLNNFMDETFTTIFGTSNTRFANGLIFNVLQNDFLLKHLIFEIFDELINELFPELSID